MTDERPIVLDFSLVAKVAADGLADEQQLHSLAQEILEAEGATGAWNIAVVLVNDEELQALHFQFMDSDEPTDIMTFPYGDETQGGELAISVDHALVRAVEWGNSPAQEVAFLTAHGVLHLLGWQDTHPGQRAVMLTRQEELVSSWRRRGGC